MQMKADNSFSLTAVEKQNPQRWPQCAWQETLQDTSCTAKIQKTLQLFSWRRKKTSLRGVKKATCLLCLKKAIPQHHLAGTGGYEWIVWGQDWSNGRMQCLAGLRALKHLFHLIPSTGHWYKLSYAVLPSGGWCPLVLDSCRFIQLINLSACLMKCIFSFGVFFVVWSFSV